MRIMPLATAIIVSAFLYFLVFERDRLMAVAGSDAPTDAAPTEEMTDTGVDETFVVAHVCSRFCRNLCFVLSKT